MNVISALRCQRFMTSLAFAVAIPLLCSAPAVSSDLDAVVHGNRQFALDLYHHLSADAQAGENLLFSPYSISTALAMTYAGARGQTAEEMAEALHFTLPEDRLHSAMGDLIRDLNGRNGAEYRLEVANRLWGQTGGPFLPQFLQTTNDHYEAGMARVDFVNDADGARRTINTWVEDRTENKIRDLLPAGSVTPDTRLVLTNAIYLQADWQKPFKRESTRQAMFRTPSGNSVEVSMMAQTNGFDYAEVSGIQLLEMPYVGDDLSMVLMLPAEEMGLAGLESWRTSAALEDYLSLMEPTRIQVEIPKFRVTADTSLRETLGQLGMPTAFTDLADFSGISMGLSISDVLHKAFIDLDEKGTEAAAATAVVIDTTSLPPPPTAVFRADRPFAFFLRDNLTDSILFMGQVTRPETPPVSFVPEPSSCVLLILAALGLRRFISALASQRLGPRC